MTWYPKTVLAISPHADDIELGAGGTIHKWTSLGSKVHSLIFSTLKMPEREVEIEKAHEHIGISIINIYDFQNRVFDQERQDILQIMIDLGKSIDPDVVLIPCGMDIHQDHQVVHNEAKRAFKQTTLLGYEDPWNMYSADLRMTVTLKEQDIEAKCKAAFAHKTQANRHYMDESFIIGMARMRGTMVGENFAESFEVVRWLA